MRRNAVARAVLIWLYDEDDSYPLVEDFLKLPASEVGGEVVGNDELVRTIRWLDDKRLIDGPRIDQVPYPLRLRLTAAGRNVLVEQDGWVQPEAAQLTDSTAPPPKPPVSAISQAFLRWLYDHNREQPTPKKFLDDPRSLIGGHQVDEGGITEAIELLVARSLVEGRGSWSNPIPLRISLTDAGRICVIDFDADPSKAGPSRTWDEVARGVPTIDKSVTVTGDGNWIIANSDNAAQAQTVDPSQRPEFSVRLGARIPGGGYRVNFTMDRGPEQLNVTVAVAVLEPQEGVTALVTNNETRRMVRDFSREIAIYTDPPVPRKPVVIDVSAACADVGHPDRRWILHRALTIPPPATIHRARGRIPRTTEVPRHPDR